MEPRDSQGEQRAESRVESTSSFMSIERAAAGGEPNGVYAPGSPSKLSAELARRLAVADSNPPQPQVRGRMGGWLVCWWLVGMRSC